MTTRNELLTQLKNLQSEMDVIARHEKPTKNQELRFNSLSAEFDALTKQIDVIDADDKRRELLTGVRSGAYATEDGTIPPAQDTDHRADNRGYGSSHTRDQALRTIDRYLRSGNLQASAADVLDHVVRSGGDAEGPDPTGEGAAYLAAVGNPAYNTAFGKLLADPVSGHLRFNPEEVEAVRVVSRVQAMRALGTGTGAGGGFALPFTLDPSVILTSSGALNPWREISRVITIATKEWRGVSSDGVVASYSAEAAEVTDNSPTLAQPTIVTQRGTAFIPFSIEVGQDWVGIQEELLQLIADARDVLDATKFLSGSGTNEPAGILTGLTTTQRVQTNAVATYAVGDPWSLKAAIPARFILRSTFAANPATWDTTYRFVGGNSTEPVQMPERGGDFLGLPKVEASPMATGATTGTKLIIGGDFRTAFTIVDRIGLTAELVPHLFGPTSRFPTGQRGIFAYWRSGSAVVAPNALRYLEVE